MSDGETLRTIGTTAAVLLSALAAAGGAIQSSVNGERADTLQTTLDVKREEWDRVRNRLLDVYYQRNQEIREIQAAILELQAKVGIDSPPLKPHASEAGGSGMPSGPHPRQERDYR